MNEYEVTIVVDGERRRVQVFAATAAAARRRAEDDHDAEVETLRFVRAAGVSCTIRDGRGRR